MKLPRSVVSCLLAAFAFASVALRYPTTSHETGVDSFFIHNLTASIVQTGEAKWILNPLSLFGLFPLSYPSAGPFFLGSLSLLAQADLEPLILLSSLLFGALSVLTSFAMAREFRDDDFFCLAASFLYAFSPRFLSFTLWTASMRGLFMVLLPIFVLMILRTYRVPSGANFTVLVLTFGVLAAVHRLGILMVVLFLGAVVAAIVGQAFHILRLRVPRIFLRSSYRRASPYLAFGTIVAISTIMLAATDVLGSYSTGELATGTSAGVELLNLAVSLGRSSGFALILGVLGLLVLVKSQNKTLRETFLAVSFLALIPTLFLRVYTGFYILPFVALLGALALLSMTHLRSRRARYALLAVSLGTALVFSTAILQYEVSNVTSLQPGTYSTATYLASTQRPGIIANDGLLGVRIASICGCAYLPIGGAGTTFQGPELLAYGYYTPSEVFQNLTRIPLFDLTLDSDSPWVVNSIQSELDWVKIMESPYSRHSAVLERYNPVLLVENRNVGLNFYAYGNTYPSSFVQSASDGAYLVYESQGEAVYYVNVPGGR